MKTIGVIVYSLTIEYSLTVINGITEYFDSKDDVNLIIIPVKVMHSTDFNYDYQYWSSIELLKSKSVDAVIVVTNSFLNFTNVEKLSKALECLLPKPVVSVSTPLNLPGNKYSCVSCEKSYLQIVEHLVVKHNCKKIAYFSASLTNSLESEERVNAYKAALEKNNLEIDEDLIFPGDYTPKVCFDWILSHYKTKEDLPFDAILCANDYMAAGCIGAFQDLGILVPEDVCVVGFDDTEVAVNCNPTITTINQQIKMTGYKAAEAAYLELDGEEVSEKIVVDSFPVYRQSCGCIAKNLKINGYLTHNGEVVNSASLTTTLNIFGNGLNDMDIIFNHMNMTDSVTSVSAFFSSLKDTLNLLHVPLFSISVYDTPISLEAYEDFSLPEKANLVIQIDSERKIYKNFILEQPVAFELKEGLLPPSLNIPDNGSYYMVPIFQKELIYGYLIAKLPNIKYPLYAVLFKIITNAFVHCYLLHENEMERIKLVERNQNLNFAAKTDELTQLFNRRGFQEYGQQLIDVSIIAEKKGAVFFCDLDGLKTINDTWGHETGDLAIKTEAKVLRAAFRDSDMVGRLSGDEFGVVAPGFPVNRIDVLRERLTVLNTELSKEAKLPFTLSISIGAMEFDSEHDKLKTLLTEADKQLYKEKRKKHLKR